MSDSKQKDSTISYDAYFERERILGFDRRYGTDTTSLVETETVVNSDWTDARDDEGRTVYLPGYPGTVWTVIHSVDVHYEDFVFVDFGSGKGRILMFASDFPFKRLVGVEFDRRLHEVAQRNVEIYRSPKQRCSQFELVCGNAEDFTLPDENLILYMFNPFGPAILRRILANVERSMAVHPRSIYIAYTSTWPRTRELMESTPSLSRLLEGPDANGWVIYKAELPGAART